MSRLKLIDFLTELNYRCQKPSLKVEVPMLFFWSAFALFCSLSIFSCLSCFCIFPFLFSFLSRGLWYFVFGLLCLVECCKVLCFLQWFVALLLLSLFCFVIFCLFALLAALYCVLFLHCFNFKSPRRRQRWEFLCIGMFWVFMRKMKFRYGS